MDPMESKAKVNLLDDLKDVPSKKAKLTDKGQSLLGDVSTSTADDISSKLGIGQGGNPPGLGAASGLPPGPATLDSFDKPPAKKDPLSDKSYRDNMAKMFGLKTQAEFDDSPDADESEHMDYVKKEMKNKKTMKDQSDQSPPPGEGALTPLRVSGPI